MNDETIKKQESSKHPEFEQKDLSATGILSFLLGLAIFGVVIHFVLGGMYSALNNYQKTHQPPQNPLAVHQHREVPVSRHYKPGLLWLLQGVVLE